MQCAEFEQRLNAVLDDRRRPEADQRLAAHAAQCENCQQLLDEHVALLCGLKNVVTPPLAPGFSYRVFRAAQPASKPAAVQIAGRQRWLAAGPLLTSAAAMLMALSAVWYLRQVSDRSDDASILVFNSPGASPGLAIAGRGPRRADSTSTNPNSADWLIDLPRLPSRWRAYRSALGDISMASLRLEEMEQLAAGMRPLRESFAVIWDTIRRTIPSSSFDSSAPQSGETPTTMRSFEQRRVA